MKYIKPTDFLSVRELQAEYRQIESDITDLLTSDASANTAAELNSKLQQALNAATRYLAKVNDEFAKKELTTAFKEGKATVHESVKVSAADANAILSAQGFKYSDKAFAKHTYIELQTATENAGKGLKTRVNAIIGDLRKDGKDSVYNVQQAILKDLQQNGLMVVEYSNGAKQSLDAYAAMAARSARIESTNIGAIGRALQAGTDLVIMTTMPQCCKLCGAYQDKVYSISGKDKRFPALFKTVLKNGYALPHPNCRHEFIPYFADAEDPADVERMIKQSRIKYDSKGRLADVRTQRDIELYQMWQAGNRQRNTEMLEYEEMKRYYAGRESEMPYKTLAAFRTARRRDELSPAFKAWRRHRIDEKQYKRWAEILGKENMPKDIDIFQQIKYNKPNEFKELEFAVFQEKTRKLLGTKEYPISLHSDAQGKHIKGHKNFQSQKDPSYFIEGQEDKITQKLIEFCGTGEMQRTEKSTEWSKKELLEVDFYVGFVKDAQGKWVKTKKIIVHYSKRGVHFVPTLRKFKHKKGW